MEDPEFVILFINLTIVLIAYFFVYPKVAGSDGNKIVINVIIMASSISLIIAGSLFWGTGQEFNIFIANINWFWFALLTYAAIEIPFMLWYFKKNNVWASFNR